MLKEQIVILIMQKDEDEKTMSQVDGMIKLIDKEQEDAKSPQKKKVSNVSKSSNPSSQPKSKESGPGEKMFVTSIFNDLKNKDEEKP